MAATAALGVAATLVWNRIIGGVTGAEDAKKTPLSGPLVLAAGVAVLAVRRQTQLRGPLLGAALALSLAQALLPMADQMLPHRAWLSFRWLLPQFAADSAARQAALAAAAADRPEYLTRWANAAGWPPGRSPDPADILRGVASRDSPCSSGRPALAQPALPPASTRTTASDLPCASSHCRRSAAAKAASRPSASVNT